MIDHIFEDLFVLELANNHLGKLDRGLAIIQEYTRIVRYNNIKAAIKLQFRDVEAFIHKDFRHRSDLRYVKKTLDTKMSRQDLATMTDAIRQGSCLTMSTPFDEASVDLCMDLDIDIIKVASSDINDWILIEKIASTRKPVIASTGGSSEKDVDDLVKFFNRRKIPLALNHCVSLYPTEDRELEMNQIDWLKLRYPNNVIGFSTHEYHDWHTSIAIAYAKGARTFERHIDIESDGVETAAYNSKPENIDSWFKAYKKAKEMCGAPGSAKRIPPDREIAYLDALVRGVYAKHDLAAGTLIHDRDVYLAIPLQKGQLSCRELIRGERLTHDVKSDHPLTIDSFDSVYSRNTELRQLIEGRGLDPSAKAPVALVAEKK